MIGHITKYAVVVGVGPVAVGGSVVSIPVAAPVLVVAGTVIAVAYMWKKFGWLKP